jgi:hypothetical protein
MADQPADKNLLPSLLSQNPAPFEKDSQDRKDKVRSQVDRIMEVFLKVLPSNYVSQVTGPLYTIQLQALAERIADFQITAQEAFADNSYDYTRSEVLWQILGALVFPDAGVVGAPVLEGDITYRTFLRRMVELLLQGSTAQTQKEGVELLTTAIVEVIERSVAARQTPNSAWGFDDQFTFEVNVTGSRTTDTVPPVILEDFPSNLLTLQNNTLLVLRALKPAHTLYEFRSLFQEVFGALFTDTVEWEYEQYHYEDFRRFWLGAKCITGTAGITLTDRTLFSDPTRDFTAIQTGAVLQILTGANSSTGGLGTSEKREDYPGHFRVVDIRAFAVDDAVPRAYTTVSGLSGTATVSGAVLTDPVQDWALAPEGDILTFTSGPNAGQYRLQTVLGLGGGPCGFAVGPSTQVRVAPSLLRVRPRMAQALSGQSYKVDVDRLGVCVPHTVLAEDVSDQFIL